MVVMLPKFTQTAITCRKKHESIFKAYKDDKLAIEVLENIHYKNKFYKVMDEWWHQVGQVMEHVLATTTSYEENQSNSILDEVESLTTTIPIPPSTSIGTGNF